MRGNGVSNPQQPGKTQGWGRSDVMESGNQKKIGDRGGDFDPAKVGDFGIHIPERRKLLPLTAGQILNRIRHEREWPAGQSCLNERRIDVRNTIAKAVVCTGRTIVQFVGMQDVTLTGQTVPRLAAIGECLDASEGDTNRVGIVAMRRKRSCAETRFHPFNPFVSPTKPDASSAAGVLAQTFKTIFALLGQYFSHWSNYTINAVPEHVPSLPEHWQAPSAPPPRWHAFVQLALVALILGTSWPVLKNGIQAGATPIWFAAARACCGTLGAFTLVGALRALCWPRRRDWPVILSSGMLQLAVFFALSNLALRYIPAGRSAVLAYTTTLWLAPLETLTGGDRLDLRRSLGLLVGLSGVGVLLNPLALDWSRHGALIGHGFLLLAALGWAVAIFHARHHAWDGFSPLQALPWQMLVASLALIFLAAIAEPAGRLPAVPPVVLALAYVGLFGGPVAIWAATSVSRDLPTLVSSLGFLGVPVVGVIVSTLWLGESLTLALLVGAALVLLGLVVVALATDRQTRRAAGASGTRLRRAFSEADGSAGR